MKQIIIDITAKRFVTNVINFKMFFLKVSFHINMNQFE